MHPYEIRFAALFGRDYTALSFWKGRVALYAILKAMELREDDEVILPAYTCVVVANAIRHAGAKPVYADILPGGFNLDPDNVSGRITARTRAIVVQHTYGIPADVAALQSIATRHGLKLIEDCAHVLPGSKHKGKLLGSFGEAAFFSSQWSKPYTTGLGGMTLCRDRALTERLQKIAATFEQPPRLKQLQLKLQYSLYRNLFRPSLYWRSQRCLQALARFGIFVGSSNAKELSGERPSDLYWRMGAFQQRSGLAEIDRLSVNSAHRYELGRLYARLFREQGWPVHPAIESRETTLLRIPLEVNNKAALLRASSEAGIEIGSWFETPLHPISLADHQRLNYRLGSCPVAESTARKVINLPVHERVTRADADKIAHFVLSNASPASSRGVRIFHSSLRGATRAI